MNHDKSIEITKWRKEDGDHSANGFQFHLRGKGSLLEEMAGSKLRLIPGDRSQLRED